MGRPPPGLTRPPFCSMLILTANWTLNNRQFLNILWVQMETNMEFVGLFLDKTQSEPLYLQLYHFLVGQLRSGAIRAGEKLPGKRSAAVQLGVSVNTVDQAYQMLAGEGYLEVHPRSGFVAGNLGPVVPPPAPHGGGPVLPHAESKTANWRHSFLTGGIDTALFPRKTWNRLSKEVLAGGEDLFGTGESQGDAVLREALAEYLQGFRGVRCQPQQIVTGAGLEVLLGLLAPLLPAGAVATENPGYAKSARLFENAGRATLAVDVDSQGLVPENLQSSGAMAAYLTPSHQFPTGCVMPAPRRAALLHWAAETGGILIEDDYDSEFRFSGRPLPSLQGMDSHHRVVYAGTFSRSLAPGIRAAYLVLPPALLSAWRQAYSGYACTLWRPEQHTLARFMREGHFARRLNQMRGAYRARRDQVLHFLQQGLAPSSYELLNTHTGLYFVLRLPGRNAAALAASARQAGLGLTALSQFRQPSAKGGFSLWEGGDDALLLGYGGLAANEVPTAMAALLSVLAGG